RQVFHVALLVGAFAFLDGLHVGGLETILRGATIAALGTKVGALLLRHRTVTHDIVGVGTLVSQIFAKNRRTAHVLGAGVKNNGRPAVFVVPRRRLRVQHRIRVSDRRSLLVPELDHADVLDPAFGKR